MTIPIFEPDPGFFTGCFWPIHPDCRQDDWNALDLDVQQQALALASNTLHALVAGRVTNCPVTVRPCPPGCRTCRYGCLSCTSGCELDIPGVVGKLLGVKVDGTDLPLDDFRVDDDHIIVYQGTGKCPFLSRQNLSQRDDAEGTWSITYLPGYPVDSSGARAVTHLALEFAKLCSEDGGECELPKGVQAVVRFGMTYEVDDALFPGGQTGLGSVDTYIDLWNPQHRRQGATAFWPGMPQMRVQG